MRVNRTTLLTILQGFCITLQMINVNMAVITDDKGTALIVSAVIGGFQYIVQHLGNQTVPASAQRELDNCLPKDSQGSQQQPSQ